MLPLHPLATPMSVIVINESLTSSPRAMTLSWHWDKKNRLGKRSGGNWQSRMTSLGWGKLPGDGEFRRISFPWRIGRVMSRGGIVCEENCSGKMCGNIPRGNFSGKSPRETSAGGECPDPHAGLQVSTCSGHDLVIPGLTHRHTQTDSY